MNSLFLAASPASFRFNIGIERWERALFVLLLTKGEAFQDIVARTIINLRGLLEWEMKSPLLMFLVKQIPFIFAN
jgi:hypothetical protein